jgi:hypothetical protein
LSILHLEFKVRLSGSVFILVFFFLAGYGMFMKVLNYIHLISFSGSHQRHHPRPRPWRAPCCRSLQGSLQVTKKNGTGCILSDR